MTATDELRRLLDERGAEWWEATPCKTKWNSPVLGGTVAVREWNGVMVLDAGYASVTPEQAIEATLGTRITGETSDGYHTFDELYHHCAVLFSVVVRDHAELAWKSKLHHDGTMYDGMFIVGIETPQGQATYHYDIDPYWDVFDCREFERAPEWDGHTPSEAVERISILGRETCEILGYDDGYDEGVDGEMYQYVDPRHFLSCGHEAYGSITPNYCPVCGRKVGGRMSYCRFSEGDVYAYECVGGVQFYVAGGERELDRLCSTFNEAYQYAKELRGTHGLDVPSHAIEALKADALEEAARICGPDGAVAELEAENEKLRELVRELYDELDAATQYDAGGGRGVVYEFANRMRELGVEV